MKIAVIVLGLLLGSCTATAFAQRISIGIAPAYDAGGDDFGPAVVQHLTLFTYEDLIGSKQFFPSLLSPGGVFTPLDTSWLTEYVQDRPDIDLLLVPTLKPIVVPSKGSWTIVVEVSLLDARSGDTKSTWSVSETIKEKNAWLEKGQAVVTSAVNDRTGQYGYGIMPSRDFEKQPMGRTTAHLAEQIRDTLATHLGGFVRTSTEKPMDGADASAGAPCTMHTRVTYGYKHSASHSYTLLANGLDETTTIADGVSAFKTAEGPMVLQFTINDAPYKLSKQPIYQLSTVHSCRNSTLVIDIGQGGDAHQHWE